MKRFLLLIIQMCLWGSLLNAQSTNQNYISTRTYLNGAGSKYLEQISYFDGLGRPVQAVQRNINPNSDLVTFQEYDGFGREHKAWTPVVAANNNGAFVPLAAIQTKSQATYSDKNAYSLPEYEASPLNRITAQTGPGERWHNGKIAVRTKYLTNTLDGELACKLYSVNDDRQNNMLIISGGKPLIATVKGSNGVNQTVRLTSNGRTLVSGSSGEISHYSPGELYVTQITDEEGNISYEFKDKLDQVILTRQINHGEMFDTYYVYDNYGNLRMVLPPMANDLLKLAAGNDQANNILNQYAYRYKYDARNRMIEKQLPGCDPVSYIYDKADRMIFSQDGEQRVSKKWTFHLYDVFGRLAVQGICGDSNKPDVKDEVVKATMGGTNLIDDSGYSVNIGITATSLLLVNYYDDYAFLKLSNFGDEYDYQSEAANAKGLQTGSVVYVPDESVKLPGAVYYDFKGNPVKTVSANHMGGKDVTTTTYSFTNKPLVMEHIHTATVNKELKTETLVNKYEYDNADRLAFVKHLRKDKGDTIILAKNVYDDLGRLNKIVRNNNSNLQDEYQYNVRSWLTRISNNLFTEVLDYKNNGNISFMDWIVDNKTRRYTYTYDNLSRLKSAAYTGSGSEDYKTSYGYDKHGNIKNLIRYGKTSASGYGIVDNLTMTYTGNQLIHVAEAGPNVSLPESNDFKKAGSANPGYAYNKNGAMIKDLNKKITSISYNSLNLPKQLVVDNVTHSYMYAADGRKLRVKQGNTERNYVGNFIYENSSLKTILVEGGYIDGTTGIYHFNLNDHLGNIRVVADKNGNAVQKNHYYPFGLPMAETSNSEQNVQPFKYNGKEFDRTNGLKLFDYSARYMDPGIGRFTTVDPLAEKYYNVSPYAYCSNNPIRKIDPTGKSDTDYRNEKGELLYKTEDDLPEIIIIPKQKISTFVAELSKLYNKGEVNDPNKNKEKLHNLGLEIFDYGRKYDRGDTNIDAGFHVGYEHTYENKGTTITDIFYFFMASGKEGAQMNLGYREGKKMGAKDKIEGNMNYKKAFSSLKNNEPLISLPIIISNFYPGVGLPPP